MAQTHKRFAILESLELNGDLKTAQPSHNTPISQSTPTKLSAPALTKLYCKRIQITHHTQIISRAIDTDISQRNDKTDFGLFIFSDYFGLSNLHVLILTFLKNLQITFNAGCGGICNFWWNITYRKRLIFCKKFPSLSNQIGNGPVDGPGTGSNTDHKIIHLSR